jgi:hypothetical protein
LLFETASHVAQTGLELVITLSQCPQFWDYRRVSPYSPYFLFFELRKLKVFEKVTFYSLRVCGKKLKSFFLFSVVE